MKNAKKNTKRWYCIRETDHPLVTESGRLAKDALQEHIRFDGSERHQYKGISLRCKNDADFYLFASEIFFFSKTQDFANFVEY